jgi:hypothetical protein
MFPRLRIPNPLKLLPVTSKINYDRLPGHDAANGSPYSSISLKKIRWRSPSPGSERFPMFVKMSLSRLIVFAITLIMCVGLIAVGGYRGHQRFKKQKEAPKSSYPWEAFTVYVYHFLKALPLANLFICTDSKATTMEWAHSYRRHSGLRSRSSSDRTLLSRRHRR